MKGKILVLLFFCVSSVLAFVRAGLPSESKSVISGDAPSAGSEENTRLRGAMVLPGSFCREDLEVLAGEWNANLVRWQMTCGFPHGKADTMSPGEYLDWVESECRILDRALPVLREFGVKVCLDLHSAPGGYDDNYGSLCLRDEEFADCLVNAWTMLAERYRNEQSIWGYDLLNEPTDKKAEDPGYISWRDLAERVSRKIREIDSDTPIVFEPVPWGNACGYEGLEPLDVPNVIYSFHHYTPMPFTHQSLNGQPNAQDYPGEIEGTMWNKETLRASMSPVVAFQRQYGVPVFVGEFSAIRWAPNNSAFRYLKDSIELFEEFGWNWTYHAFRESPVWSVELSSDRDGNIPSVEPTDRELLLREYFARNKRFTE